MQMPGDDDFCTEAGMPIVRFLGTAPEGESRDERYVDQVLAQGPVVDDDQRQPGLLGLFEPCLRLDDACIAPSFARWVRRREE